MACTPFLFGTFSIHFTDIYGLHPLFIYIFISTFSIYFTYIYGSHHPKVCDSYGGGGVPVVLRLKEVELLLDPVDGLVDGQLERRRLRCLEPMLCVIKN
jgi:hypothetical protein